MTFTVQNFAELARTVALNWQVVDTVTLSYCKTVARLIKERHSELIKNFGGALQPQQQKKKNQRASTKHKSSKLNIAKEKGSRRSLSCKSPPPATETIDIISNTSIVSPDTSVAINAKDATMLQQECSLKQQLWIDQITSMPFKSATTPLNQKEQTSLDIHGSMQLEENPTTLHTSNVITPPAPAMPPIDLENNDDFDEVSTSDFKVCELCRSFDDAEEDIIGSYSGL